MTFDEHSIRKLSANFIIASGTQVVLQATKLANDNATYKKPGSVGVILQSPPDNQQPYLIQFTDGSTVEAKFDELSLRRAEVDNELAKNEVDFRRYIIYRCQTGSKAYGLSCENSDDDIRGIFLPPANLHWSLYRLPEQLETTGKEQDEVFWELEKFLKLALKANPNVLETLWTPLVIESNDIAQRLLSIRHLFLSKHLYKTYSGYVLSQFRRMKNSFEKNGTFKTKHAMHLIRLLYSGIEALKSGNIMVDASSHRDELLSIRNGQFSFEEVKSQALALDKQFQQAFDKTDLPEQPDYQRINAFLIWARREMTDA